MPLRFKFYKWARFPFPSYLQLMGYGSLLSPDEERSRFASVFAPSLPVVKMGHFAFTPTPGGRKGGRGRACRHSRPDNDGQVHHHKMEINRN